jgi:hypothetical protein
MGNRPGEFSRQSSRTLKFPNGQQPSRKELVTIYHYHYQPAPVTPLQGYLLIAFFEPVTSPTDGVLQHGSTGTFPLFSLDSEARTMSSLGSKTSEWLSLCHLPLSCRLRVFCTRTHSLSPDPSRRAPSLTSVPRFLFPLITGGQTPHLMWPQFATSSWRLC